MAPIGMETPKHKAGKPCNFQDPKVGFPTPAIFAGIHKGTNKAYIVLDDGSIHRIPLDWLL